MGTEIVFVIIYGVAAICLLGAVLFWSRIAKIGRETGIASVEAYAPLFAGFVVSMIGLAILTYIESFADFTSLIQQGYYTETQRAVYLPRRVVGNIILQLVFLLPIIAFVVVPLTVWLIRRSRLTFKSIGLFAILGWFALSLLGWVLNVGGITPPDSFLSVLGSAILPVLLYGLPIPVAAVCLLPPESVAA